MLLHPCWLKLIVLVNCFTLVAGNVGHMVRLKFGAEKMWVVPLCIAALFDGSFFFWQCWGIIRNAVGRAGEISRTTNRIESLFCVTCPDRLQHF